MTFNKSYRRILNKMGYYNYQQDLIYRYIKQKEGWDNHLMNCRRIILKALAFYKPEKVTILGSGWLLDLPLVEMLENTGTVNLVDIIHPPEVIRQVKEMKGVELLENDITGGLVEEVWEKTGNIPFYKKLKSIDEIVIPEYQPDTDPGMVISLNILTQLEVLLVDFIRKRAIIEDKHFKKFRTEIQKKHIDFLKHHRSVLISDTSEEFIDKSGNITEQSSLLTELPESRYREDWIWDFDLKRSDYFEKRSIFKVLALIL